MTESHEKDKKGTNRLELTTLDDLLKEPDEEVDWIGCNLYSTIDCLRQPIGIYVCQL